MKSERRRRIAEMYDRMRLAARFQTLADDVLPGEGFADDEITDAMIRTLCKRVGDRAEVMDWVKDIADTRFDAESAGQA